MSKPAGTTESKEELLEALGNTSTPATRLRALGQLHFRTGDLARALGVTPQTIRAWVKDDSNVRSEYRYVLDELRLVVKTLLEGGLDDRAIQPWFTSKPGKTPRPIDLIRTDPDAVLIAAEEQLNEAPREALRILEDGSAPPDPPASEENGAATSKNGGSRTPADERTETRKK